MVHFCSSCLPLTLVIASEPHKEPVKFVRFIMLLFSFQTLPKFKAEEAKVPSEVGVAGFSSYTDVSTAKTVQIPFSFFFLIRSSNPQN